jgi:ribosomal protein RSM22 (predicted rRNA methylase)
VTKKHTKEIFHAARKAFWGDMFYLDRILKTPPKGPRKYFPTTKKRTKELKKIIKIKKRLQKLTASKQQQQQQSPTPFSPPPSASSFASSKIKHPIR